MSRIIEKPDGARDVYSWYIYAQREYRPVWALGKNKPVLNDPTRVVVNISVEFWSDEAAREFENKVREMLPEVGY